MEKRKQIEEYFHIVSPSLYFIWGGHHHLLDVNVAAHDVHARNRWCNISKQKRSNFRSRGVPYFVACFPGT